MSIPRIRGYSTADQLESIADLWTPPAGEYPSELWPHSTLREIVAAPTDWVRVEEHYFENHRHGGRGAVLIGVDDIPRALSYDSWIGHGLGSAGPWSTGGGEMGFDGGLAVEDRGIPVEFLVQVRSQHNLRDPVVEISHSFLWYWDAIETDDGWSYLDEAGYDQPLLRYAVDSDSWSVDVRALELRRYLADAQRVLVAQVDHVPKVAADEFQDLEAIFENDWARFSWACSWNRLPGDRSSFSRLLGKYVLDGSIGAASPRWEYSKAEMDHPEFIYGIDPETGSLLRHTCNPDELGTYFDGNDSGLHYLTPVNFTPDVLSKYTSDPHRYHVQSGYLRCLDLWGVRFSFNTADLVEVYLGDIGRDIPSQEWSHWLNYNVRPEGQMSEDRFRRDFLAQFASSDDPTNDIKRLRVEVNSQAQLVLGGPIWRELDELDQVEFERLFPSTTAQSLKLAVLSLCKAFVEAIDQPCLINYLSSSESDESPLASLENLFNSLGGSRASLEPLRALQQVRSKGGIAHMVSSQRTNALKRLGIHGMDPMRAFQTIAVRIRDVLIELHTLLVQERDKV